MRRMDAPHLFRINPHLNLKDLRSEYAARGRVSIVNSLMPEAVENLYLSLRERNDWHQVINSQHKIIELSRSVRKTMNDEQRTSMDEAVYAAARYDFQYRYETIRVPDNADTWLEQNDPVTRFATWMTEPMTLDLVADIIGDTSISFADAQATAYSPGDFLTAHDDNVEGKHRRAAYVFGLTKNWRPEWGGLLMFHDRGGVIEAWPPCFNSLNIFRVPQVHSVSEVTRAAAFRRYSITGWFRSNIS